MKETFGLIPDSFDPRDVWADEVLAGEEISLPPKYSIEGLNYEQQFAYPFCVSFAATTMLEWHYKKAGKDVKLSQPHLFFHAGGGVNGSSFRPNLDVLKGSGAIDYDKCPMPTANFGADTTFINKIKQEILSVPFTDPKTLGGYVRIKPDEESIRRAIMQYGPVLVGVNATVASYYTGKGKREKNTDNHGILRTGWDDPANTLEIFESLGWAKKNSGYATLDRSYTFNTAYAITELPANWREVRDAVRSEPFQNALNHYGLRRDYEAEVKAAALILSEFKRFNNQSVLEAAGRFFTVLINMVVYGGYNISYTKYGIWKPGDILNFVYHWRRTGEFIFDPNKERKEYA